MIGLSTNQQRLDCVAPDDAASLNSLSRPKPPMADKLVSLILRVTDNCEGVGIFNRDQRIELLQAEIERYENVSQSDVAYAMDVWGRAMQSAATAYLKPD